MNKTKFMTRIFSAINNEETEVLEQLDKDIDIAKEDGSCDTDQYVITASDDGIILHDKVNNEDTEIIEKENGECTFSKVDLEGNKVPDEKLPLVEEKEFADNKGPWCVVIKYVYTGTTKKTWHVYPKDKADELVKSGEFMKTWYKIVGNTYNTKEEAQHAMVDLKASKKFSEMTDEELDEKIKCDSLTFSRIKKFSLESLKSFAKGGWRDGKLYIKMGDSDVALDLKNKVAIVIDENLSCAIDPKKSFIDNLTTVEKFMKENDLKVFSDENPTPEQEGVINFLKGFVEEHPGEAKYLVELGAKWGPDNLLEGLNHDAEGDKSFSGHLDRSNMTFITDNDEYRKGDTISSDGEQFELVRLVDNSNDEYTWSVKAYSNKFSKFSPAVAKMFSK